MKPARHPPEWPPRRPSDPPHYSANDARGAEIILRTRAQRWIFFGGLAAFVILAIVMRVVGLY